MATSTLRRWIGTTHHRFAIGLAAFAIAAGVTWFALNDSGETARVVAPPSSPPIAIDALASSAAPASAPEVALVDEESHADDEVQMCGGEWVKTGADGEVTKEEAEAFERRALEATKRPALEAMEASGDERVQAAAHFFQGALAGVSPDFLSQACAGDDACVRSASARRQAAEPHRATLVRLAQSSSDPQIYAWAYRSCNALDPSAEGTCQLITAEQWARLDPTNARPWLAVASEAERRQDTATLDDAMFHVASAERMEAGWGQLPLALIEHVPPGETHLVGALELAIEAIGVDGIGLPAYQTATKYCGAKLLADANRRETCERIAGLLVDRSTTLMDRNIGSSMGKRLGWPAERLETLREEREALFGTAARDQPRIDGSHGCADVRRELDRFREVAAYGELGTLRRAVDASGKPVEQLAADFRQAVAEQAEKAQQAEAAASAASAAER